MSYTRRTKIEIARRIAQDIPDGACINLGVGIPTLVGDHLPAGREIILHSENGILGMGPSAPPDAQDWELINAGKEPVTLLPGGVFVHHADSFAMIRGGHIDISVLGAYQVSIRGDLANWSTGDPSVIPGIGGAVDLAAGARQVWVAMDLLTRHGVSKIVEACSYPLTGSACVSRVYGDLATLHLGPLGVELVDTVDGLGAAELERILGIRLARSAAPRHAWDRPRGG